MVGFIQILYAKIVKTILFLCMIGFNVSFNRLIINVLNLTMIFI